MKTKEMQRADEQQERKELLDWLKGLKYQDDLAENILRFLVTSDTFMFEKNLWQVLENV